MSLVGLSCVKKLLKDKKGEGSNKSKQPLMQKEPSKISRRVKERAMRDEKEDAEEMETAANEGMFGGERSHLQEIELLIEELRNAKA